MRMVPAALLEHAAWQAGFPKTAPKALCMLSIAEA